MKNKTGIVALIVATALTQTAGAESWGIQIGAFKNPDAETIRALETRTGLTATSFERNGYQIVSLGSFTSRREAVSALSQHASALPADAFIRAAKGLSQRSAAAATNASNFPALADLPASLRSRVVYLDGVLHVKEGDKFTPLSEISGLNE